MLQDGIPCLPHLITASIIFDGMVVVLAGYGSLVEINPRGVCVVVRIGFVTFVT